MILSGILSKLFLSRNKILSDDNWPRHSGNSVMLQSVSLRYVRLVKPNEIGNKSPICSWPLKLSKDNLPRFFKQTIDEGTSLIAIPSAFSSFKASKFPSSLGNLCRFEQPERLRRSRDFNLHILLGSPSSLKQFPRFNKIKLDRRSMDEGSSWIAVPSKDNSSILQDSSGKLMRFEQPERISFLRDSKWVLVERLVKLLQCPRFRTISLFRYWIEEWVWSKLVQPWKFRLSRFVANERSGILVRCSEWLRFICFKLTRRWKNLFQSKRIST